MRRLTAPAGSVAAAGTQSPTPNQMHRRAMRILRPQPEPPPRPHAPAVPPAAGAGGALLRCRVRRADGRVFTGALPPARHRALQLGMLHADTAELVELTPGTRGADGKLELDRRRRPEHYLPGGARRPSRLARGAARARRADRGGPLRGPAIGRPSARGGVRRRRAARAAPRRQARDRAHALSVGRRRPARPAPGAVGAARLAAVSPADRVRRLRRRARLLEARRAARRHARRARQR